MTSSTAMAELKLYDADNQYLGVLEGAANGPFLYLPSLEMFVVLEKDETGTPVGKYASPGVARLYYSGSDCGQPPDNAEPYVYAGDFSVKLIITKGGTNNYYGVNITSSSVFTPVSYLDESGICHNNSDDFVEAYFHPLESVTLPFSSPITLPYRAEYTESKSKVAVIPLVIRK
jgi:hypothetical protein